MKIKELMSDIRVWIGIVVFFIAVGVAFAKVIKIPERVDKIEEKSETTEDNVQQLASDMRIFVETQKTIQAEQDKREALIIKLIEQTTKEKRPR